MTPDGDIILKISKSQLPERFKKKLMKDLSYIWNYDIPELRAIVLFGSGARGELRPDSDLDLLLLTDRDVDRYVRGDVASQLDEPSDEVKTDVKFYNARTFAASDCRFVREIKRDGIILWKEEGYEL